MAALEFIKESIDGLCLLMYNRAAIRDGISQMAVVIPFDVGDVIFSKNCIDLREHMVIGALFSQI